MTHTRTNPPSGAADLIAARELELFIENDAELYRKQHVPIIANLDRRRKRGMYDRDKAVTLFMYLVEEGARKYLREFDTGWRGRIDTVFNRNTRLVVAKSLRDSYEINSVEDDARKGQAEDNPGKDWTSTKRNDSYIAVALSGRKGPIQDTPYMALVVSRQTWDFPTLRQSFPDSFEADQIGLTDGTIRRGPTGPVEVRFRYRGRKWTAPVGREFTEHQATSPAAGGLHDLTVRRVKTSTSVTCDHCGAPGMIPDTLCRKCGAVTPASNPPRRFSIQTMERERDEAASNAIHSVFGHHAVNLSAEEGAALIDDIHDITNEPGSSATFKGAAQILRGRIGGVRNLTNYAASLVATNHRERAAH